MFIHSFQVAVAASTGLAASLISDGGIHGATTVHSLMGLRDGRFSVDELTERMSSPSETYEVEKVQYLKSLDTVIVDEVSMISAAILDQIECVCRAVKKNDELFGGIQMILVGDFKQLRPVPNIPYGDKGDYIFKSSAFVAFPHIVHLHEVFRYTSIIIFVGELKYVLKNMY